MKKLMTALLIAAVVSVGGFVFSQQVSAAALFVESENGATTIAKETVVDGSAYLAGDDVLVKGTVNGDLYCAGNSVRVEGTIKGDVLCAAQSISIGGTVEGDVRAAAATVTFDGTVNGNASLAAAMVTLRDSAVLGGDLTGAASEVIIDGKVERDILIGAEKLSLAGTVGRDVRAGINKMYFGDNAKIGGNLSYQAENESSIPADVVAGETSYSMMNTKNNNNSVNAVGALAGALLAVLAIGLIAVLGAAVMPRLVHATGDVSWKLAGLAFLVGLTTIVIVPILAVLSIITVFGSVVGYVLFLIWMLLMALAPVGVAYLLGVSVWGKRSSHIMVRSTVGALLLMFLLLVPILNVLVFITMLCVGVGLPLLHVPKLYGPHAYEVASRAKKAKARA